MDSSIQCLIDRSDKSPLSTVHNLSVDMDLCFHVLILYNVSFDRNHKLHHFLELNDYGEEASLARKSKWPFLTLVFGPIIHTFAILRYIVAFVFIDNDLNIPA